MRKGALYAFPLRILALPLSVNCLVPPHTTVMLTVVFVMGPVNDSFAQVLEVG